MGTDPLASHVEGVGTDGELRAVASCSICFAVARPTLTPPRSVQAMAAVSRVPAMREPTSAAGGRCPRQPGSSTEYVVPLVTLDVLTSDGADERGDAHALS